MVKPDGGDECEIKIHDIIHNSPIVRVVAHSSFCLLLTTASSTT